MLAEKNTPLRNVYLLCIQSIEERMKIEDEWLVASILDPAQVKSILVSTFLEKKNTTIRNIILKFVQLNGIEGNTNENVGTSSNISSDPLNVHDVQSMGVAKRLRLEMLQELEPETSSERAINSIDNEIDQYLLIASSYPRQDDVLKFWSQNKFILPRLFKLALNILGLSLTSSFCEHAFSISGALLNKKRSKLNPVRAQKQLFINANYKIYESQRQVE